MKFKAIKARNKKYIGKIFTVVDGKVTIEGKEYNARIDENAYFGISVCAERFANGDRRGGRIWFDKIEVLNRAQ